MNIKQLLNTVNTVVTGERFSKNYTKAVIAGYGLLVASQPAMAADLVDTGRSIFTYIYGGLGVVAGITGLVLIINAKFGNFLGVRDIKKGFFEWLIYTAGGFGIVAIIQLIKTGIGTGSASSL